MNDFLEKIHDEVVIIPFDNYTILDRIYTWSTLNMKHLMLMLTIQFNKLCCILLPLECIILIVANILLAKAVYGKA